MTVAEVASILKLNEPTIRIIDAGTLPALHIGRRVRIYRADFDALIERSAITHEPPPSAITHQPPPSAPSIWDGVIPPPQVPPDSSIPGIVA